MQNAILKVLLAELNRRPITLLCILSLTVFSLWSGSRHALAETESASRETQYSSLILRVDSIGAQVMIVSAQYNLLELSIQRASLESEITNSERELFGIQREIEKAKSRGEQLPDIYSIRAADIQIDRDKYIRSLEQLDATIAAANVPKMPALMVAPE